MALNLSEAKKLIDAPTKTVDIKQAVLHESKIRFHVECFLSPSDISRPVTEFLEWVNTLIPKDKYAIFVSLFKFPTPIIELTESIFGELERVYEGRNPVHNYQFTDPDYREDWEHYRTNVLHEPHVWRKDGWRTLKTAINSVVIIDVAQEQTTERPEPYFFILNIENVIDYNLVGDELEYIIFRQDDKRVAVYDDVSYRIFEVDELGKVIDQKPIVDNLHDLGYCPAKFFWNTPLTQVRKGVKKSPLSNQLSNLDWLLFFSISKRHLDLYAPYPIYSSYEADCDFENVESGDFCDGGFIRDVNKNYKIHRDGIIEQCPLCAKKRLAGVGSFIEIPVPIDKDSPDLREPVSITTIDSTSLSYNVDEVNRLTENVRNSVVGVGGNIQQTEAINDVQVAANFESRISILNNLKRNLEAIQLFTDATICKLRYGTDFISLSISMGTEFYIYTAADLYGQYKLAKTNGASSSELNAINEQILITEHRNDPIQLQRMLILKQLEPYPHYTFDELMTLKENELLNKNLLNIKINFNTFIERFERENTNVIEFGSELEFNAKIDIIKKTLESYGKDTIADTGREIEPDGVED